MPPWDSFSFLFGSCSKSQVPVTPLPGNNADAKADGEKLLNVLLPFAKLMLQQEKEFYPFGGHMDLDGKITQEGAWNGSEHPPSQELIKLLRGAHQSEARSQKIRACATIYDVRTIPPGRTEKQDAVAAAIDHVSGYSVIVVFPYTFDAAKNLQLEAPFAVNGAADIFARPKQSAP